MNFYFNYNSSINMSSFHGTKLDMVEVRSLIRNIKTKFIKIVIFKKQTFYLRFKYKNHESLEF